MSIIKFIHRGSFPSVTGQATKKIRAMVLNKGGKQFAKATMYTSSKGKNAIAEWMSILEPHAPSEPINSDCHLTLVLVFPYTKEEESKAAKGKLGSKYVNYLKADTDNLEKMLKDCMAKAGYITNDNLIAHVNVIKARGPEQEFILILQPAFLDQAITEVYEQLQ